MLNNQKEKDEEILSVKKIFSESFSRDNSENVPQSNKKSFRADSFNLGNRNLEN